MSLPSRREPCRFPRKTRKKYGSEDRAQTFLISRNRGSSSETYLSAASRTTHARDTFFFLAILSRESYVSDGIVTDSRGDRSALGELANIVLSAICITLHQSGAYPQQQNSARSPDARLSSPLPAPNHPNPLKTLAKFCSPSLPINSPKSVALKMEGDSSWHPQSLPPSPPPAHFKPRQTIPAKRPSKSVGAPGTAPTTSRPRTRNQPIGLRENSRRETAKMIK
jgi:hypothetical protein